MKEYLAHLVHEASSPTHARNLVREYLQARVLGCLQRAGAMIPLAFHGGTAPRFLYGSQRYSEDLDFALERDIWRYDFRGYLRAIDTQLALEGYTLDVRVSDNKVVNSAFVRFPGLLHELELSAHPDHMFSVKIEVDTNPPAGAVLETSIVRRHLTLHLQHHDRASLLAGNVHAILQRPYAKGRDVYDLLWSLSDPDWPEPNLRLLNNALQQTGWTGDTPTAENWREVVCARLQTLAWDRVVADVRPFLDPAGGVGLLTLENVLKVLGAGIRGQPQ
jgi:hypothetical protein